MKKVLDQSNAANDFTLKENFNLIATLDLDKSQKMKNLMEFIGYDQKSGIPLTGSISKNTFNKEAKGSDRFKGLDINVPMPNIDLENLPEAFSFENSNFKITDKSPSGDVGIWVGIATDLNGNLMGQNIAFNSDIGFADEKLSLKASSDMSLPAPFGIEWLELKNLKLALAYDKKNRSGDLEFKAEPSKPFGKKTPKISIDLNEEDGKLKAGILKIEEEVAFLDLPILADVPHAEQFSFTFLEISNSGISGGSILHDQSVDVVAFKQDKKWTFAASDNGGGKGFKFRRILPAIKDTPLGNFHLNDVALVFSDAKIAESVNKLPEVAQDVFTEIYGSATSQVNIGSGITIIANFSPSKSQGNSVEGFKGIGLHDDILVEGALENIFGGKKLPSVDVFAEISQGPSGKKGATHVPTQATFPEDVGFFIQFKEEELDVGLQADTQLDLPNDQSLKLATKLELELNLKEEDGFAVGIFMDLSGNWDEPFGIPGIDLEEVALKFDVDMEGNVKFGLAGKAELAEGAERVDVRGEISFLIEDPEMPDAIAFRAEIKELGIPAMIDIAERMAGDASNLPIPNNIPLPEYRDVVLAFATPGFSDPQLGLVDSGFKLSGEVYFMGHELGKADIAAGPTGIKMKADVDPIDLEILELKKNTMLFNLNFEEMPKLEIDSQIEFLGAEEDVTVKFSDGVAQMEIDTKIGGGVWDSTINLGFHTVGKHVKSPDIFIEGEVKADFFAWLKDKAPAEIQKFFDMLNAGLEKAKEKINAAQKKVDGLNSQIQKRKEVVQREKANADKALETAKKKAKAILDNANSVKKAAKSEWSKCHWYSPWHCAASGWDWTRYGVEWAAYETAEGVLEAAKQTVDHLPSELMDPELAGLETAHGLATGVLSLAKLAIDGVEEADKWIASGLEALVKKVGESNALVVKEIFFEGDLAGMTRGHPMILTMDLEIFGKDLGTQMFAFKLDDPVYDAEQLAFIPLHMVTELFEQFVPSGLEKLLGPVLNAINSKTKEAERKVYAELKNIPGLKLPPELEKELKSASRKNQTHDFKSLASNNLTRPNYVGWRPNLTNEIINNDKILLTASFQVKDIREKDYLHKVQANNVEIPQVGSFSANRNEMNFSERFAAYKDKKKNLLLHTINRNRPFGESLAEWEKQKMVERAKLENDHFLTYTDIHVPPGELFTEKLLVVRHSKLCLGQTSVGKVSFHPCNENTGGLLWSTKRRLVNNSGKLVSWNNKIAKKFPERIYTQLIHNGACLTTPFTPLAPPSKTSPNIKFREKKSGLLQSSSLFKGDKDFESAREEMDKKRSDYRSWLAHLVRGGPSSQAHLKLEGCRKDGQGQLWKVVKTTHSPNEKNHGFKLQERDSSFCLRPNTVKAHTKKKNKEVNGIFYPCTGVAHATFELKLPNNDMPIWYDHNGVIKSENGYCLQVPDNPALSVSNAGSIVYMNKCSDNQYDRWDYVVEYDKTVKIINDFNGHCLYPYDKNEGAISDATHNQLVQRPCDGRYGQGWKMRILKKQKWFQLEALDSAKKLTGMCMLASEPNPGENRVKVNIKSCNPATRGRWQFGHWKGSFEWTEWNRENQRLLSKVYWVSKDDLSKKNMNGVCRVLIGNHEQGNKYDVYPGTWFGKNGICAYIHNGEPRQLSPSRINNTNYVVEVLSGIDLGVANATGSWKESSNGVPFDVRGQNLIPPNPMFSPFLAGGNSDENTLYLCRVKGNDAQGWAYGYQAPDSQCTSTFVGEQSVKSEVLIFASVKNASNEN